VGNLIKWFLAKTFFRYVLRQIIQPSTLRSLARLLGAFGVVLAPQHWEIITASAAFVSEVVFGMGSPDRWGRAERWVRDVELRHSHDRSDYSELDIDTEDQRSRLRTGREDLDRWNAD